MWIPFILSHHTNRLKQQNCCNTHILPISHAPNFPCAPYTCFSHSSSSVSVLCDPMFAPLYLICGSLTLQGTHSLPPHPSVLAPSLQCGWLLLIPSCWQLLQCPLVIISNHLKTKTTESSPIQRASTVLSWGAGGKGTLKYLHQSCMQNTT